MLLTSTGPQRGQLVCLLMKCGLPPFWKVRPSKQGPVCLVHLCVVSPDHCLAHTKQSVDICCQSGDLEEEGRHTSLGPRQRPLLLAPCPPARLHTGGSPWLRLPCPEPTPARSGSSSPEMGLEAANNASSAGAQGPAWGPVQNRCAIYRKDYTFSAFYFSSFKKLSILKYG